MSGKTSRPRPTHPTGAARHLPAAMTLTMAPRSEVPQPEGKTEMDSSTRRFLIAGLSAISAMASIAASAAPVSAEARQHSPAATYEFKKRESNDIAATVVVSGISCTCARFAEDIRNVVNDLSPDGLRILPVLGNGGLQNLKDVLFLRNLDMAVVDEDNMRLLKKTNPALYANIDQHVQYITKLYNSEFQVLARNDIKSYEDLKGKRVSFNLKDSQTEVTAETVFNDLNIPVQRTNYDNDEALKRLKAGDISAMIILTGAPQVTLSTVKKEDGLHFLPLDQASVPSRGAGDLFTHYLPAELTHEQYPKLIDEGETVPTIANRALLVAYAWPEESQRYKRLAKFVDAFFSRIDQFNSPSRHPKWKEVNLAAEIPGWTRFKPAAEWLAAHRDQQIATSVGPATASDQPAPELKAAFETFMQNYVASTGGQTLSVQQRDALFEQFKKFLAERKAQQANR